MIEDLYMSVGVMKDSNLNLRDLHSTHLTYTEWCGGLEHLKIDTRLIDERVPSVMGECVI
jgi:hypothetical protein